MSRNLTWFSATVIEPDPRTDAVHKMTKIGFRQYDALGDKSDEMGNYFGFTERVDEHIGDYSLRLQLPGTYTQTGGVNVLSLNLPIDSVAAKLADSSTSTTPTSVS